MRKILGIVMLFLASMLLFGCAIKNVSEVKKEEMVGETVTVEGVVKTSFKLGTISGYILEMEGGELTVSSKNLLEEGKKVTVKGVVMKELLVGYYLLAKE